MGKICALRIKFENSHRIRINGQFNATLRGCSMFINPVHSFLRFVDNLGKRPCTVKGRDIKSQIVA